MATETTGARVHDWQRVEPMPPLRGWRKTVTHRCARCGATYPEGSVSFPCPGGVS